MALAYLSGSTLKRYDDANKLLGTRALADSLQQLTHGSFHGKDRFLAMWQASTSNLAFEFPTQIWAYEIVDGSRVSVPVWSIRATNLTTRVYRGMSAYGGSLHLLHSDGAKTHLKVSSYSLSTRPSVPDRTVTLDVSHLPSDWTKIIAGMHYDTEILVLLRSSTAGFYVAAWTTNGVRVPDHETMLGTSGTAASRLDLAASPTQLITVTSNATHVYTRRTG